MIHLNQDKEKPTRKWAFLLQTHFSHVGNVASGDRDLQYLVNSFQNLFNLTLGSFNSPLYGRYLR